MEQFVAHLIALLVAIYSGQPTPTTEAVQHHPAVTIPEYAPIHHHPAVELPEYAPTEDWSEEGFVEDEAAPTPSSPEGSITPEFVEDSGHVGAGGDS